MSGQISDESDRRILGKEALRKKQKPGKNGNLGFAILILIWLGATVWAIVKVFGWMKSI